MAAQEEQKNKPVISATRSSNVEKVFGLGPGRSGTDALRSALIKLGFGPSYHMKEILFEETGVPTYNDIDLWHQAALLFHKPIGHGKKDEEEGLKHLATILDPWASGSDWPLMAFPQELLKLYPNAKFILTIRPTDKWYRSMSDTICIIGGNSWYMSIVRKIPVFPFNRLKTQFHMMNDVTRYVYDDKDYISMCDPANSDDTMQWYDNWNAKIMKIIPNDQLLVFNTGKDGYEELASFLNVTLPKEPYPSVNSTRDMKIVITAMQMVAIVVILVTGLFIIMLFRFIRLFLFQRTDKRKKD